MGLAQNKQQILGTVHLQEDDYSLVQVFQEDEQPIGAQVLVTNPSLDSLLSEMAFPVSLVFHRGEDAYLVIGFCAYSSFLPPMDNWFYSFDFQYHVIRQDDGSFFVSAPFRIPNDPLWKDVGSSEMRRKETDNPTDQSLVTIQGEDFCLISKEEYNSGYGVSICIHSPEILSQLKEIEHPVISVLLGDKHVIAYPRDILDPPRTAFFAVDPSGKVILSEDGKMEFIVLDSINE